MVTLWFIVDVLCWMLVLLLGVLLLGSLRAQGIMRWRLEQLELITPTRLGRGGLKPGTKAPDFTLPSVEGKEVSLHDCLDHKLLLVLVQPRCNPCQHIVPELNRVHRSGEARVLVVTNSELEAAREWATKVRPDFPVLVQKDLNVSKRYEAFSTPFGFLIDDRGVIVSKGIVGQPRYIRYLLDGATAGPQTTNPEDEADKLAEVNS
jgi:methylamine dehydrogenase accessory protein MauD